MTILLVGNSILGGMMPYIRDAFVSTFGRVEVVAESHDGASTAYWRNEDRLASLVRHHQPGVVVLELGTNDVGSESDATRYANLVRSVADVARSHGARLVWIGPMNGDAGARERFTIIRSAVGVDDAVDGMALTRGLDRAPDGLHFVAASYRTLAERMAAAVVGRTAQGPASDGIMAGFVAMAAGAVAILLVAWAAGR